MLLIIINLKNRFDLEINLKGKIHYMYSNSTEWKFSETFVVAKCH